MFCESLVNYKRIETEVVDINGLKLGKNEPILPQTMTNTLTKNIESTLSQILRCIDQGVKLIRVTTPTLDDVKSLKIIIDRLKQTDKDIKIVADIHFSAKVAIEAAKIADKIRINPGNFVFSNKLRTKEQELMMIEDSVRNLIDVCIQNNTTVRIGTNQGSLSKRILQEYGNTPKALVASTLEYIEIFEKLNFNKIVISLKSSNPLTTIFANRLLVEEMKKRGRIYPLHLGVTEAGSEIEGRIKSAIGIGCLLADGIGDTIRVSLTEPPEMEIPYCNKLLEYVKRREKQFRLPEIDSLFFNPFSYQKRKSRKVLNVGGDNYPVLIANLGNFVAFKPDFFYDKQKNKIFQIIDYQKLKEPIDLMSPKEFKKQKYEYTFVKVNYRDFDDVDFAWEVAQNPNIVLVGYSETDNFIGEMRHLFYRLKKYNINSPVVLYHKSDEKDPEIYQIIVAIETGMFLIDGFADGIWLENSNFDVDQILQISYEILQATGRRITKAEFISCPSCGRTFFDIEKITKKIKERLMHLKGIKIAVMGCIVNGLGEMADADYGYVGAGPGKVNIYKGQNLIKENVDEHKALDALIEIIKNDNKWQELQKN